MAIMLRDRILPLHLSAADQLMLAQDLPGYPATFTVQLEFLGQIDQTAWEAALRESLERHPLLTAYIRPGKGGLPCWTAAEDPFPSLDWATDSAPIWCPHGEAIDLSREIGLRVWVRQGPERSLVLLQYHHAASDGTGAYRFIGDLLACYGQRTDESGTPPVLAPVQIQMLRSRKDRLFEGQPLTWPEGLAETWRLLVRHPTALATPPAPAMNGVSKDYFPGFLSASLDREDSKQLRSAADQRGAMLNDLLLRDMFLTLDDWNREQNPGRRPSRLRIMMPTDMRVSQDCEMPAANLTSYTFLTRYPERWTSADDLLASIQAETQMIKSRRSGTKFMNMVAWATRSRRLLPYLMSRNTCLATAVLSNAADPSRRFTAKFYRDHGRIVCGNLVLESISGVPPLRAKTHATFSISQYDRRVTVSLRCDPHSFRPENTAALLELYMCRLRQSVGSLPAVPM
jgi:hypothetical protein